MKFFLMFFIVVSTCLSSASEKLEICINAKVYKNIGQRFEQSADPQLGVFRKFVFQHLGDTLLGHAFVTLKKSGKQFRSYGYWPDDSLVINSDEDTLKNGVMFEKTLESTKELCFPTQFSEIEKIEQLAQEYEDHNGKWTEVNNCVQFAKYIFESISGIKLQSNLPIPLSLYRAIARQEDLAISQAPDFHNEVLMDNPSVR